MITYTPISMNLELTTFCPLKCPQCYCNMDIGKQLDIGVAINKLEEASKIGVKTVNLSGGESLCYPYLYDVVERASKLGMQPNVSISGVGFTESVLKELIKSGVYGISVSLNGTTEEINSKTRDGYVHSRNALNLLKNYGFENTTINWVMHRDNAFDFINMVKLAEQMKVCTILVLAFKPDAKHEIKTFPTGEQINNLANEIRKYKGNLQIAVQTCFSQLLAVAKETKLLGNLNIGPHKGCPAGRSTYTITVDGLYAPCRHLEYHEQYTNIEEYWNNSPVLHKLRNAEQSKKEPCLTCRFSNYCLPCFAVNSKLNNEIYIGHEICDIWRES